MVAHEELKAMLAYDPATGDFVWKSRDDVPTWWNTKYAGNRAGSTDAYGYVVLRINARTFKAHRIAWFYVTGAMPDPNIEIDHINGDRRDNSIANLRLADDLQNAANACVRRDNSSGVKGVSWHRRIHKWQAQINECGRRTSLGYFDNILAAQRAYQERAQIIHGEFARVQP